MKKGYTLIELLVVIAVMGMLAVVAVAGTGGGNQQEKTKSAVYEIIASLRLAQNRSLAGFTGFSGKKLHILVFPKDSNFYLSSIGSAELYRKNLPQGTMITNNTLWVCLFHPAETAPQCCYNDGTKEYCCSSFACNVYGNLASPVTVSLFEQGYSKNIKIEGDGIRINRIYEE